MTATSWALSKLESFPEALAALLANIDASVLDWRPPAWDGIPSEQLTIRQQVCHLRDIEADGYAVRFTRLLHESNPLLESIDTYALVRARNYDATEVETALADFRIARLRTLGLLRALRPGDLARRGQFEGYGDVSVESLIHYLCSHDQQHVAGITWLLGAHAARP